MTHNGTLGIAPGPPIHTPVSRNISPCLLPMGHLNSQHWQATGRCVHRASSALQESTYFSAHSSAGTRMRNSGPDSYQAPVKVRPSRCFIGGGADLELRATHTGKAPQDTCVGGKATLNTCMHSRVFWVESQTRQLQKDGMNEVDSVQYSPWQNGLPQLLE